MRSPSSLYRYSPLEEVSFPAGSVVKNLPANEGDAGDMGLIPGSGRSPGVGNGNPLQYSCLEESMDRGARQVAVHGAVESDTTERPHTLTQGGRA